ncbi:sensor histidine kinase [Streptomyces lichenis]|uniref:histidine kinase n=1 Tax=Streptomyces lichenis TaxID=2306967 RepID=A0ABT0I6W5_9ACTN|nr:nitrate- and nitrite sensing domain-containing protein [Streptomyces lichenis]MCK8677037.1 nitrate- and nitrite sensing domain-containing protein [Streptomyces lichenis]
MQGRFKRDGAGRPQARKGQGEAAAEQEAFGGSDRGSSPQHTRNPGQTGGAEHPGRPGGPGQNPAAGEDPGAGGSAPGAEAGTPGAKGGGKSGAKGAGKGGSRARSATPSDTGSRLALRNWRISTRLVALLTLPVVAATTLGGLRINESMNDIEQLDHMQLLTRLTQEATSLATALQNERDMTAGPLSNGYSSDDYTVADWRKKADQAQQRFLKATEGLSDTQGNEALQSIRSNVEQIAAQVITLGRIRTNAYSDNAQDFQTVQRYGRLIDSLIGLSQDMAQATSNPEMIKRTRALAAFSSAKEYASIQRAIIAAALPETNKEKGKLDENDREYGYAAHSDEQQALRSFEAVYSSLGGNAQELLSPLGANNPSVQQAERYSEGVLRTKEGLERSEARNYLDWTDAEEPKMRAMKTIESQLLGEMESTARELRQEEQQDALINGALILLVLGVSLIGAFVVARSMIRSLRRLQDTATRVAQDRLPELVKQLSESDPQDVDTSVESVGVHSRDEIGKVAAAFDDVHREAVRLAAEQALLRGNVNAMFTNLSRRSQGLIQRQLSLISELESREADPDQLSSLFKLDHLATRMRRNGENLLVLAGEEPGRRWTRPVPLVDVLRAAASEVEQYERIELASVPGTEVAGRVVNDLVHLLAELLENATSFSSPQTKVRVTGHALPDGRVLVEIHDTGIGLSPEDLAAINERLASPPTVDVSVSRRMGLFVVGRLSLRHGIRIQLRPSDSGGTTALVMLPVDVAQGKKLPGKPGAGAQGAPGQVPPGAGNGNGRTGLPGRPGGAGGQLGAGGNRAALPGNGSPGRGGNPQNGQGGGLLGGGQQGGRPQRPAQPQQPGDPQRQGAGAFGAPAGAGAGALGQQSPQGGIPTRSDVWGNAGGNGPRSGEQQRPAAPAAGSPRGELPGGTPQQQPQPAAWNADASAVPPQGRAPQAQDGGWNPAPTGPVPSAQQDPSGWNAAPAPVPPQARTTPLDAPRGHEEPESTGQHARPAAPQDPASTAQFAQPDYGLPQAPAPQQRPAGNADGGYGGRQRPGLPAQPRPEALPPAPNAGDGRTPLYDTLETNWAHGQGGPNGHPAPNGQGQPAPAYGQAPQRQGGRGFDETMPTPVVSPQQPQHGAAAQQPSDASTTGSWRTTPNDDLGRQAERVRKPAAGGVTTSGLPRRVPRQNLVAGTAQESARPAGPGPQVSRAPDDVRGRLTNLRRGIQQGRQAGGQSGGGFGAGTSHQQER